MGKAMKIKFFVYGLCCAFVLYPFISVQANEKQSYVCVSVPHWFEYEDRLDSMFGEGFSGSETGYSIGMGISARNKWSVEATFGEAANVNVGLLELSTVSYRYMKLKPRFYSFAVDRQFPILNDSTFLVSKLGFSHSRIKVEGLDPYVAPRKHDLDTNLNLFLGARKRLLGGQADVTLDSPTGSIQSYSKSLLH